MKRKLMLLALLMSLCSILTIGTLAYFTSEERAHNIITTGNIAIELQELTNELDETGQPVAFENVHGVMPGSQISKIAQIKNTGSADAYVRVKVDAAITLSSERGEQPDLSLIQPDYNLEHWLVGEGGYFYYRRRLKPGETTVPLFTKVTFAETMDNRYQNSTAIVDVRAQAVQADNNGDHVLEARGWPELSANQ